MPEQGNKCLNKATPRLEYGTSFGLNKARVDLKHMWILFKLL